MSIHFCSGGSPFVSNAFPTTRRRDFDELVDAFLGTVRPATREVSSWANGPALNAWETPEALSVELEVPGLALEDLDLSVTAGVLQIAANVRSEKRDEKVSYHRRERRNLAFSRTLSLPFDVNVEKVEATLKNGILTVVLPKAEAAKPRKITVAAK